MQEVRLKLSPPWVTYINELIALFDCDPQIGFNIAPDEQSITIACNNGDKCAALAQLLPAAVEFGNIVFTITIDGPMSNRAFVSKKELFEVAFENNPIFIYAVAPADEGYYWYPTMTYVVFENCVVQFFNDNLNDCHGIVSTLYQDIALDVFADEACDGVCFNTAVETRFEGPLGEWP